ncbi:electron transfer flavoprotein subunit beta/FixA family protein [Natronolimnohabitans sp. A-GB9]|uniref:electron transfer flavoprotein subunit beta/FixA family protein n=1 Tax=Natronolimnohabitans sp. A-GB9 TaxID=3069757 RepID=UPI0027B86518|nr:electron transfer flavoprotein subunit beta/FixA family protein [Natronolimnohabitans sp. A-GB9]MDQ2052177.1 electron transfer flavoprotein subunit beta/FixA family protein [Natronolimnohabitans sp. A-GB9]
MKALVSVAEVAELGDDFEIDGLTIDERYLGYSLNEWDDYAIEEAVTLSEADVVDEVVVVTIGPERSEQTIREALAKGADRAIRIWDDAVANVDALMPEMKTRILASVVEAEEPDIVFTGVQSDDDAWGATGVALAEEIDFGWAAVVTELDLEPDDGVAHVRRELEGGLEEVTAVELPAVITIQTGINQPRYASLRGIRQAQQKELAVKSLDDLGLNESVLDSELALTELYEPETESETTIWDGEPDETAAELASFLRETEVIES